MVVVAGFLYRSATLKEIRKAYIDLSRSPSLVLSNCYLQLRRQLQNCFAIYMQGIPACKMLQKQLKREFRQHAILRKNDVTKIAHIGTSSFFFLFIIYIFHARFRELACKRVACKKSTNENSIWQFWDGLSKHLI